jgi:hypothetical protein
MPLYGIWTSRWCQLKRSWRADIVNGNVGNVFMLGVYMNNLPNKDLLATIPV